MNPSPAKTLFFLPAFIVGGAERVMVNLSRGFVEAGHPAELLVAKAPAEKHIPPPPGVKLSSLGAQRMADTLPRLVRYLRQNPPAGLVCASTHVNLLAIWARALSGQRFPLIVSEHSLFSLNIVDSAPRERPLLPRLARWFYPAANAIVTVSHGAAADLARSTGLRPEQIRVIYNPIVTPELAALAQEPLDHPFFEPGEPPVVLAVGRFHVSKDYPNLLEAFARVRAALPALNPRLIILGDGEDRPALEAQVRRLGLQTACALPGFSANPYAWMARASLFVMSSQWEGLPSVLIEAMACGTPVAVTRCPGGSAEILEDGRYGRLAAPQNPAELAQAMIQSLQETLQASPEARQARAAQLRARAAEFSIPRVTQQYLELLYP